MPKRKKRSAIFIDRVSFRCSEAMMAAVQHAAAREQLNPSDYARRAVMRQLHADGGELARKKPPSQLDRTSA